MHEDSDREWTPQCEYYERTTMTFGKASECISCGQCEGDMSAASADYKGSCDGGRAFRTRVDNKQMSLPGRSVKKNFWRDKLIETVICTVFTMQVVRTVLLMVWECTGKNTCAAQLDNLDI